MFCFFLNKKIKFDDLEIIKSTKEKYKIKT